MPVVTGALNNREALKSLLHDISNALAGGRRQRRLSDTSKRLYLFMLQNGGALAHDYVSQLFLGPDLRTTRRIREKFDYPFMIGLDGRFFDIMVDMLGKYSLLNAPLLLSEDGTALQIRMDIDVDIKKQAIFVYGLCGTSYTISTVGELRELVSA